VVGTRRGERGRVPGAEGGEHVGFGEGQADDARSVGPGEGKPGVYAWGVKESEA